MATEPTVDVESILAPIAGDDPCGTSLRFDPVYDEIRKARSEENRNAIEDSATTADWALVVRRAGDAIQNRSKDLMLAAWLLEALAESSGFAGFRDGLTIVSGLLERYWDGVYPRIEDGDVERRLAPILWLTEADRGGRIANRVRDIGIVPSLAGGRPLSWVFWKSGYATPKTEGEGEDTYAQRQAQADERNKQFQDAVGAMPLAVVARLRDDLAECREGMSRFDALLSEKFGVEAPGTSGLREAIEDCSTLVERLFKEKGGVDAPVGGEPVPPAEGEPQTTTSPSGGGKGPITSREDAFQRLAEIAAYFRRAEPHSPIPYVLERAVYWGNLPLDQLLEELIKDQSSRDQVGELIGLKRG